MSALTSTLGGMLNALVSVQRGMTEDEARQFLISGELPDLSKPPGGEESATAEVTGNEPVMSEDAARAFLANITPLTSAGGQPATDLVFKFNENQPRDSHGRWADAPGGGDVANDFVKTLKPRGLTGKEALESAPVSIAADNGNSMVCRPPELTICNDINSDLRYQALENYRGTDYYVMNQLLRGVFDENDRDEYVDDVEEDWPAYEEGVMDKSRRIDETMDVSRLREDVTVMRATATGRGIFDGHLEEDLTGFEWDELGYSSATVVDDVLDMFTGTDGGLVMHILVPKGVGAIQLSSMPDDETGYDEAELLLQRGLHMRVIRDAGRDDNKIRYLWVEASVA